MIRTLEITKSDTSNSVKLVGKQKTLNLIKFKSTKVSGKPSTLENFFVKPTLASYKCNFCRCNSHSAFYCKKYPTLKDCNNAGQLSCVFMVQVLHIIPSNVLVKIVASIHVGNVRVVNTWEPCVLTWRSLKWIQILTCRWGI